jgi:hypothetical protein
MPGLIREEGFWVFREGSGGTGCSTRPKKRPRKRPGTWRAIWPPSSSRPSGSPPGRSKGNGPRRNGRIRKQLPGSARRLGAARKADPLGLCPRNTPARRRRTATAPADRLAQEKPGHTLVEERGQPDLLRLLQPLGAIPTADGHRGTHRSVASVTSPEGRCPRMSENGMEAVKKQGKLCDVWKPEGRRTRGQKSWKLRRF